MRLFQFALEARLPPAIVGRLEGSRLRARQAGQARTRQFDDFIVIDRASSGDHCRGCAVVPSQVMVDRLPVEPSDPLAGTEDRSADSLVRPCA